eukprot:SM000130S27078  [mRNA]  locus=s130:77258:82810:+ [translate_table: standard]
MPGRGPGADAVGAPRSRPPPGARQLARWRCLSFQPLPQSTTRGAGGPWRLSSAALPHAAPWQLRAMDGGWRSELTHDARERIVSRIMEVLQKAAPTNGQDGMSDLLKLACKFEQRTFSVATDQSDYLRKISVKMLSLENKVPPGPAQVQGGQGQVELGASAGGLPVQNVMSAGVSGGQMDPVGVSHAHQGATDMRELVFSKLRQLREKYLPEFVKTYKMLEIRSQQPMPTEQADKANYYKDRMATMISYLAVQDKGKIPISFTLDKVEALEKQIIYMSETFNKRRRTPNQAVKDAAPVALGPLMSDLRSMLSAGERYAAAPVVPGSRGALGKDLVLAAAAHVQALVSASASQLSPSSSTNKRKRAWAPARPLLLGSAEDTAEARRSQSFRQMLEREIRSANDILVDTLVEIDEASTSEAALFGKDGCVLSLAYIGFKVLLSPLLVLIPQDYPASSPDIWDDPLVQYQSHHLAVAARGHFKRRVMAAPPPLSIQAIATAWDDSARSAVLEAVVPNGGGCLATSLGSWQSCLQAAT